MKIAFIVGSFPQISETFILNQITGLMDLGHDVDIYAFQNSKQEQVHDDVIKYGLLKKTTFFDIPEIRSKRVIKLIKIVIRFFIFYPKEIIKCFNCKKYGGKYYALNNLFILPLFLIRKYDIIHCHFGSVGNESIFLKDIFPDIKFIVTFHGYDIRLASEKNSGIYKRLFDTADRFLSICNYNTRMLEKLGCPSNKIIHHPNGINIDRFRVKGNREMNRCFIITTIARLVEEKNISFALEVIRALKECKKYKFKYFVIGNGYLKKEIEMKICNLNLKDIVTLFNSLPQAEVIEKLRETDIFFLPSKQEAFPTVLLEAQSMGIPVIASAVGGVGEAIRDRTSGFLIANNNIEEAKTRFIKLMENPSLILSMGEAGKKFIAENFNIHKLNKRLVEIYAQDLQNGKN